MCSYLVFHSGAGGGVVGVVGVVFVEVADGPRHRRFVTQSDDPCCCKRSFRSR